VSTAKDYRTWGGTLVAAATLAAIGPAETTAAAKSAIAEAMRQTAVQLGNTATITRKCYVHPAIIDAYERSVTLDARVCANTPNGVKDVRFCERAVLELIAPGRSRRPVTRAA
jgi:DNA topoisomerase-1